MKKNKFIINNKPNKLRTLVHIISLAGMINCSAMTIPQQNEDITQASKSISLGYTSNYQDVMMYNDQHAMNTLKEILSSDLNKLVIREFTNEEIQKELNNYLTKINTYTLDLARAYKSLENHTIKQSGLTPNEIYEASNELTLKVDTQHNVHTMLDRLSLVRLQTDEKALEKLFKLYKNKKLAFSFNTNNVCEQTAHLLNFLKEDMKIFMIQAQDSSKEEDNGPFVCNILSNLDEIELLINDSEYTEANSKYLSYLINSTPELLPAEIFGTLSMRRGLIVIYSLQHSMNSIFTNLKMCGYNLDNFCNSKTETNMESNK